jgi:transketolase
MRNCFAREITRLAASRSDLVLLSGDIGNRLFDEFKSIAPERFINGGVAEANLISVAAGLAAAGMRPVCYSIASFLIYRTFEQIRLDLAYHRQPVTLVGTGAGLSYGSLGPSHHSLEEMGILRLIPGLTVLAPADCHELRCALHVALETNAGPTYIRIGKKGEPDVHVVTPSYVPGRGGILREGRDAFILALGTTVPTACAAADQLRSLHGLECGVASAFSLKPLDLSLLQYAFRSAQLVITLEEHAASGGLGTAVAEWLAEQTDRPICRLIRLGAPDEFAPSFRSEESGRAWAGLTAEQVTTRILHAHRS